MLVNGEEVHFTSPRDARARGIATVYQDLAMVPLMSIWRNFFLGEEPTKGWGPLARFDTALAKRKAREIAHILMEDEPADSLLVTEVITPAGHWSSFPPHKHDVDDPPRETLLEETYYHRVRPTSGFGFQRVYTEDATLDEAIAVRDGDVVLVPRGYHPVAAGARHDLYYLNVMAGPVREWRISADPAFN